MNLKSLFIFLMLNIVSFIAVSASNSGGHNVVLTEIEKNRNYDEPGEPENPDDDNGVEHLARRRGFGMLIFPELSIDGYSLYFNSLCNDCDIQFLQDGEVVYEDSFDSTGEYEIPSFLDGTYEIRLYVGYSIYIGTVNL